MAHSIDHAATVGSAAGGPLHPTARTLHELTRVLPEELTETPGAYWPGPYGADHPVRVLWSRSFIVEIYEEPSGLVMTVLRNDLDDSGRRRGDVTWDDLQCLKWQAGYGGRFGFECYPPDDQVINARNERHIFIPDERPRYGWHPGPGPLATTQDVVGDFADVIRNPPRDLVDVLKPCGAASAAGEYRLVRILRSREFQARIFEEPSGLCMTVNRLEIDEDGKWRDGIGWSQLQSLKRQAGYGASWAFECYPPDEQVVNPDNMRFLWIRAQPPNFGWHFDSAQKAKLARLAIVAPHRPDDAASAGEIGDHLGRQPSEHSREHGEEATGDYEQQC